MLEINQKWEYVNGMSKKFCLLILILMMGCANDYIEKESSDDTATVPLAVQSIDVSVDTVKFSFNLINPERIEQIQVQRDSVEVPLTHYDGSTVFFYTNVECLISRL